MSSLDLNGVTIWKGLLDRSEQEAVLADLRGIAEGAPFRTYETPGGKPMSVRMTGAGAMAWVSDRKGYRYAPEQPDGQSWPEIPASLLEVWTRVAEGAKMGMHQDRDEAELSYPVVSISLGDEALFRVGGATRGGPTKSVWLESGDVAVLSGAARLAYHGIDRLKFGTSSLLPKGGRINVTLRVAGAYSSPDSAGPGPGRED